MFVAPGWHALSLLQPLSKIQISNAFNMDCPLCGETSFYPHKMLARHCLFLEVSDTKLHQDTVSNVSIGDEMYRQIVTVNHCVLQSTDDEMIRKTITKMLIM
jgi:hypothetical protein